MNDAESKELADSLRAAAALGDRAQRTLRTAAVVSEALQRAGVIAPVLVGGGAVEIYTRSAYTTRDLDFVAASSSELEKALGPLGFVREGRHWVNEELGLLIEFPSAVLAPAVSVSIDVEGTELRIIAVEDLIVDRLASWKHWGWDPDGAAATLLLALHPDLDEQRLQRRAEDEDVDDALSLVRSLAKRSDKLTDAELSRLRRRIKGKK